MEKSKVLVVGGTGFVGRRMVRASLAQGHRTFVLMRPDIGMDVEKLQLLLSFKARGAVLVEASIRRRVGHGRVAVAAAAQARGGHQGSRECPGIINIEFCMQRFLPSEFGVDPARMGHALEPGRVTFDDKMVIRKAIEEANIPHTYVSANCLGTFFAANLSQLGTLLPPKERVRVYGDGNVKVIFMDEDDVATYTIKSIDDPRTLNKTIYLRPPENILSQNEMIAKWERLSGKVLEKIPIPSDEFLASMKGADLAYQLVVGHFYHIFYEGCLTNFGIENDEEASLLYPEVQYTRMDMYMERYL